MAGQYAPSYNHTPQSTITITITDTIPITITVTSNITITMTITITSTVTITINDYIIITITITSISGHESVCSTPYFGWHYLTNATCLMRPHLLSTAILFEC